MRSSANTIQPRLPDMVILRIRRRLPIGRLAPEPSGDAAPAISAAGNGYPQSAGFSSDRANYPKIAGKPEPDFKLRDIGTIIVDGTA